MEADLIGISDTVDDFGDFKSASSSAAVACHSSHNVTAIGSNVFNYMLIQQPISAVAASSAMHNQPFQATGSTAGTNSSDSGMILPSHPSVTLNSGFILEPTRYNHQTSVNSISPAIQSLPTPTCIQEERKPVNLPGTWASFSAKIDLDNMFKPPTEKPAPSLNQLAAMKSRNRFG